MENKEYILSEFRVEIEEKENIANKLSAFFGVGVNDFSNIQILKKSIDGRKKQDIHYSYNISFYLDVAPKKNIQKLKEKPICDEFDLNKYSLVENLKNPVIVGTGPSGLFAGYILASLGAKPIIVEQGKQARARQKDVEDFWKTGSLDEFSNVQFGHGGAGTFSDGKLNSRINNIFCKYVLEKFVEFGANKNILYSQTPHVGSDVLMDVLTNLEHQIELLGGKFLFNHTFIDFSQKNGEISSILLKNDEKKIEIDSNCLILCIGHSSRNTFEMLHKNGVEISQKPLSIGLRIQHKQEDISRAMYGEKYKLLPPAEYRLSCFLKNGRCVYTFCNCPGGYVVNASSEKDGVVCNGMSYSKRDGRNTNSALLVNVNTDDYKSSHPLAGMYFQREWEQKAYAITNSHKLPVQLLGDFMENKTSTQLKTISVECKGETQLANLNNCLPKFASESIKQAVKVFEKKIIGFANPDAVLVGVETRSSSPVTIIRDEKYNANIRGMLPCGEGAGYAGGIMSASVDGIKVALSLCKK